MPLLAIPNISVGTPGKELAGATTAVVAGGARLLDVHSDEVHNRSVLTTTAEEDQLVAAMVALAQACRAIDLRTHRGVHPRVGTLDVCPIVPFRSEMGQAIETAHRTARAIAGELGAPVFLYGDAATREATRDLPDIRSGGLARLTSRIAEGLVPDEGPSTVDPSFGVVLVGARGPVIAFNVWLEGSVEVARAAAAEIREPHRVRSLGLEISPGVCQVSMNLVAPDQVSIDEAFARVETAVADRGATITATEIVGLVEDRFMPEPDAKVARLLVEPGHSLESALSD
ncbi:MAG: glutamate formiminotransferase / 5-formyltetrahydrofolate cyclo-ligase [Actinomycetota bacterium]|nr:glutamate formiminotransferase / 5-formyltetrahydrofolate cyclo-ligase [Actinomycetota bacterium]